MEVLASSGIATGNKLVPGLSAVSKVTSAIRHIKIQISHMKALYQLVAESSKPNDASRLFGEEQKKKELPALAANLRWQGIEGGPRIL